MTVTFARARELALALPEAAEQDHHGMPSFRVRGKIFATASDQMHLRVMVDEAEIRAAVSDDPVTFEEFWWGSRLACVVVDLRRVAVDQLAELLDEALTRAAASSIAHPRLDSSRARGGWCARRPPHDEQSTATSAPRRGRTGSRTCCPGHLRRCSSYVSATRLGCAHGSA